ncbi:MAG TPA: carboxypeptidase-like regulatory domain-containing protein, partial [Agriterribacter sp.]|nr:carboxypeptidase-like regulatory domain-containing protein [Agriterribacter sp.]
MIQKLDLLMYRFILICSFALFTGFCAQSQSQITGKVTSGSDGSGIPNVSIVVKGSNTGTTSDSEGLYSIQTSGNSILIFSGVSFQTKEVPVNNRTNIDVVLEESISGLDEVVVVGYGTQRKASLTGAIATVQPKEIQNRPQQNVMALLQGAAPGLHITTNSGRPGREGVNALVRGRASYGTNNGPLVVIDGVPGTMDVLNPDDIEA